MHPSLCLVLYALSVAAAPAFPPLRGATPSPSPSDSGVIPFQTPQTIPVDVPIPATADAEDEVDEDEYDEDEPSPTPASSSSSSSKEDSELGSSMEKRALALLRKAIHEIAPVQSPVVASSAAAAAAAATTPAPSATGVRVEKTPASSQFDSEAIKAAAKDSAKAKKPQSSDPLGLGLDKVGLGNLPLLGSLLGGV